MKNDSQELMKQARTSDQYDSIWRNVGKCVFCDLKEKYILLEENGVVLTINLYPYIDGQLMAIPRRHVSSPKELTPIEWETMRKFSYIAKKIIKKVHNHKGMWTLIREGGEVASMTVSDHLHMQLIPFDSPDLCKWNCRELNYTPIENIELYRNISEEISNNLNKFSTKYSSNNNFDLYIAIIIKNENYEILFEKKKDKLSLPKFKYSSTLELNSFVKNLIKKVTNSENKFKLINSQFIENNRNKIYQNISYIEKKKILLNTYECEIKNSDQISNKDIYSFHSLENTLNLNNISKEILKNEYL